MNNKLILEKELSIQKFSKAYGGNDEEIVRETYKILALNAWQELIRELMTFEGAT